MVACRRRSSLVRRGGQTGVPATASAAESTPGDSWGPKTGPSCRRRSSLVSSCRRRSSLVCRDGQTDVPAHAIGGGSRHSACSGSFNSARLRLASLRMTRGRALAQHCPGRHVAVRQSSTARDGTRPRGGAAPPGMARGHNETACSRAQRAKRASSGKQRTCPSGTSGPTNPHPRHERCCQPSATKTSRPQPCLWASSAASEASEDCSSPEARSGAAPLG